MTTESIPTRLLVWHEQTDPTKLLRITDAIRRGDPLPPIEAMAIGHKFLVLDGAHRAQAHQYCHRSEIRARLHNLPLSAEVPGWSTPYPAMQQRNWLTYSSPWTLSVRRKSSCTGCAVRWGPLHNDRATSFSPATGSRELPTRMESDLSARSSPTLRRSTPPP